MLCRHPFVRDPSGKVFHPAIQGDYLDGVPFPCGQCLPCRINRRRVWTLRLMLESMMHAESSFVTLTYTDDTLPYDSNYQATLCKRDLQLFFKRLRKTLYPDTFRYFACGEYGSQTHRPHYHAIIFGVSPATLDPEWLVYSGRSGTRQHPKSLLYNVWQLGLVHVGSVTQQSVQYVAGYVTKKLTKKDDSRVKEFSLMSLKPAIGARAVEYIVQTLQGREDEFKRQLRIDGKTWPVGRYLLDKIRERLAIPDTFDDYIGELRKQYLTRPRSEFTGTGLDWLHYVVSIDDQRYAILDRRDKIFNKRHFEVL